MYNGSEISVIVVKKIVSKEKNKSGNQVVVGIFLRILDSSKWKFELTGPDQILQFIFI